MVDLPPPTGPINNRMRLRTSRRWAAELKYWTTCWSGFSRPKISSLKKGKFDDDVKQLIGMVVDAIFKLNEMARALSINPSSTIELAQEVQRLERLVDAKYRSIVIKALNDISVTRDLLLLKDAVEGIEGMADKCQEASDSLTILALSM